MFRGKAQSLLAYLALRTVAIYLRLPQNSGGYVRLRAPTVFGCRVRIYVSSTIFSIILLLVAKWQSHILRGSIKYEYIDLSFAVVRGKR